VKCGLAGVGVAIVVLLATMTPAHADDDEPWATGVSDDQQARANAVFFEGNELFSQLAHAAALEKYKAAIALWDHPMIRFNTAVTLIRLDRILEAADELERALRFGDKPFPADLYEQVRDYETLIKKQLGYIVVGCDQPDTHLVLDGRPWFDGPGTRTVRVTTGEHTLVAERAGHLTSSRTIVVAGGATATEHVTLMSIESAVMFRYPQPRWLPWTVAGAGAAVALGGLVVSLAGRRQMDRFATQFVRECPGGCEEDLAMHPELADEFDGARLKGRIGASMMISGGVIVVGGLVWGVLNRPKRYLPRIEAIPTPGGITASADWRF
jgi:hypothetical protein